MFVYMLGVVWIVGVVFVFVWKVGFGNGNDIGGLFVVVFVFVGGFGKFFFVLLLLIMLS